MASRRRAPIVACAALAAVAACAASAACDARERTGGRGAVRERVGEQQRAPLPRERQAAEVAQQTSATAGTRVQLTGRM